MGILVFASDARALGYCSRGMRRFFADHGMDYLRFVRNGIPEEALTALNDDMANRVVKYAHERAEKEGQI